jgi:hypothetical protein
MTKTRASIFDDPGELDVSGFEPKPAPDQTAPPPEAVKAVSEAANFRSRDPAPASKKAPKREPRRYRTGRNQQFNVKAKQETIDLYYAITDQQGWVLGETLEKALAALQRELASPEQGRGGC